MRKFGLIGRTLSHSFSKQYFTKKFNNEQIINCTYENFELETIGQLNQLLIANPELCGLNVTIPYKESVMPYLHHITPEAMKTGAVNCIKIKSGELYGYNTDIIGFEHALKELIGDSRVNCFVLGSGGASKAIKNILHKTGIQYCVVSQQPKPDSITYNEIEQCIAPVNLYINATPLGMYPNVESCPGIPYHLLTEKDFLFDLVYNPSETLFLKNGKQMGCKTMNGQLMLEIQAEESWKIWNS